MSSIFNIHIDHAEITSPTPNNVTSSEKPDANVPDEVIAAVTILSRQANRWLDTTHLKQGWETPCTEKAQQILTRTYGPLPDLDQAREVLGHPRKQH